MLETVQGAQTQGGALGYLGADLWSSRAEGGIVGDSAVPSSGLIHIATETRR